jgi:hypothetical protein
VDAPESARQVGQRPAWLRRADLLMALGALAGALWITGGLWANPDRRVVDVNRGDQALFEWLLTYSAHSLTHLENPLWTPLLNAPLGVNLAANTSVVLVGWLFAPLTLTLGPSVTFVTVLTLNLAATAYAWYHFLSRHVVASTAAAALGGAFCGFAPGLVSHANGHLNFTGQFLVPVIIWRVFALREPGRAWRNGTILGVLLAAQWSVGAEVLFFTALGVGVFTLAWAAQSRVAARAAAPAFLPGMGVAVLVTAALLAYPMWLQFAGPQRYHGTGFDQRIHSEDVLAYGAFPKLSLAGLAGLGTHLAPNPTEENSFYGSPLLILAIVAVVAMWRRLTVRAMAATALVVAVLSFGPVIKLGGHITRTPLPYSWLAGLPLFDSALPSRLALITVPIVGMLLALLLDATRAATSRLTRLGWSAAIAVALVPLLPMPVPVTDRAPVPHFFASGDWRGYVDGGTVVAVPPTSDVTPDGQRWQTEAMLHGHEFPIAAGFFLGPGGPNGRGRIGPVPRPTYALLTEVARTGEVPTITPADRERAREDLRYWQADVVVLDDGGPGISWTPHHDALLTTVTALLGPGERVDDVWLWRVLVSAPG